MVVDDRQLTTEFLGVLSLQNKAVGNREKGQKSRMYRGDIYEAFGDLDLRGPLASRLIGFIHRPGENMQYPPGKSYIDNDMIPWSPR